MDEDDELVSVLPIHYSNGLAPNIQVHQFPLLTRPLQAPPSALLSGKRINARIKPNTRRLEVHVPADSRPEVWNADRAKELGSARLDDDREKNQDKAKEGEEPRLSEVRLRSEEIPQKGSHMLGIVRNGSYRSVLTWPSRADSLSQQASYTFTQLLKHTSSAPH